jgi:hypothetical protein
MEHARRDQLEAYVTRDGSTIREWAGPGYAAGAHNQSLAEATVAPGGATIEPHRLRNTGAVDLVVVCACSPPYSHEDTVLLEEGGR